MITTLQHKSVLLEEAINALNIQVDGIYIDGTFGRGGHSKAILQKLGNDGRLIAFDKDPEAIAVANDLAKIDSRFCIVGRDFSALSAELKHLGIDKVNGILLDIGVSSPQIDDASRGFSFRYDAPLDMRMDTRSGISASQWLALATEAEIKKVIKDYGEERFAGKIAAAIVNQRESQPLTTTRELATLIAKNVHTREPGQDPATRTFQAIRIHINQELDALRSVLPQAVKHLIIGGTLAVISFHSLEDRIVKHFMKEASSTDKLPKWAVVRASDLPKPAMIISERARRASAEEISQNPRARSALLRVAKRGSGLLMIGENA